MISFLAIIKSAKAQVWYGAGCVMRFFRTESLLAVPAGIDFHTASFIRAMVVEFVLLQKYFSVILEILAQRGCVTLTQVVLGITLSELAEHRLGHISAFNGLEPFR